MFTGIVEEIGTVLGVKKGVKSSILTIQGNAVFEDMKSGDSMAVNGVCLTVTGFTSNTFIADVMGETLSRSSLGSLKVGSHVNLERAMPADGRFGGHIVSGHIDDTGIISAIQKDDNAVWYTVKAAERVLRYVVEKGSIAIDGVSLTVAAVTADSFRVSLIPHTVKSTVLAEKAAGDIANLENDVIGKYVEKLLGLNLSENGKGRITREFLAKAGY